MLNKQTVIAFTFGLLAVALAGCNGAPTVIVMPVTNTPDPRVIQVTVTDTSVAAQSAAIATTAVPAATTSAATVVAAVPTIATTTIPATAIPVTPGALPAGPTATPEANAPITVTAGAGANPNAVVATAVPAITAQPNTPVFPVPTDTRVQLYIAQEDFQHGYMFWISSTKEDWVLFPAANTPANQPPSSGEWRIYKDTFQDGEPETDPNLIPPSSSLYQPRRGFGKLWRTTDTLKDVIGWATTPEFGLTTSYVYQPGGNPDATQSQWVIGPGTHFIVTLGRETFAFHEPAQGQQYGTWNKVS